MSDKNQKNVEQEEDLPTYVVIIIGVICAAIVIALTIVLIILCYKRRQSIKKYEEENSKSPTSTNLSQDNRTTSSQITDNQLKPAIKAYDNPAHSDRPNTSQEYEDRKSPVFTTQSSQFDNHDYYQKSNGYLANGGSSYAYENQSNVQRERSFKGSNNTGRDVTDGNSYPMNPASRNNSSSADKPYLYLEDPYRQSKDAHNNSGDGSMGSDANKPKKVMYEVVV